MSPDRKRRFRLIAALGAAVLLAVALVYTSFSAASDARSPAELLAASSATGTYEVYGKVVPGSISGDATALEFEIADREDPAKTLPVTYSGQIPDPFRDGREVIITAELQNGTLVAEHDSLITKCPSKFADEAADDPEHVIIDDA